MKTQAKHTRADAVPTVTSALIVALGKDDAMRVHRALGGKRMTASALTRHVAGEHGPEKAGHLHAILPTTGRLYVPSLPAQRKMEEIAALLPRVGRDPVKLAQHMDRTGPRQVRRYLEQMAG